MCLIGCFLVGSGPPRVPFLSSKFGDLLKTKRGTSGEINV